MYFIHSVQAIVRARVTSIIRSYLSYIQIDTHPATFFEIHQRSPFKTTC